MRHLAFIDRYSTAPHGKSAPAAVIFGFAAFGVLLIPPGAARADQVIISGVSRAPVTVETMEDGQLRFHTPDGRTNSAWIDEIDRLTVDRGAIFLDLNEAERNLASGDVDKAIVRYRRALRRSESFWPDFIAARLVQACARADQIDQAALHFVRVVRGEYAGPRLATRLIPKVIPTQRTQTSVRAIDHLDGALRTVTNAEDRIPLEFFRYALLDGSGDARKIAAARQIAAMRIPMEMRFPRAYAVQVAAFRQALGDAADAALMASLDTAIADCPRRLLAPLLLVKGETMLRAATTREANIRASWPLMRIAIHMPQDPLTPRALLGAARALERIGNKEKAVQLLEESLAHVRPDKKTAADAQDMLNRLKGKGAASSRSAHASGP